jgi:hypothetical protein
VKANLPQEIGIAYIDADGHELGSIGGATDVVSAEQEAQKGLLLQVYPKAVRAIIYAGRSYPEGEQLKVVTR